MPGGWEKAEGGVLSLTGARMPKRDIVERLRDGKIDIAYRDRLIAASEIERLRTALREIL
jgi:hypothetical protein